jgi:hypothetical protein
VAGVSCESLLTEADLLLFSRTMSSTDVCIAGIAHAVATVCSAFLTSFNFNNNNSN